MTPLATFRTAKEARALYEALWTIFEEDMAEVLFSDTTIGLFPWLVSADFNPAREDMVRAVVEQYLINVNAKEERGRKAAGMAEPTT